MKQIKILSCSFATLLLITLLASACSNDKLPAPQTGDCDPSLTYDGSIKSIIDNSCAFTGCHVTGGDGPGDFSTYATMQGSLDNGSFKDRVVDQRDMPIAPGELSAENFDLVKCWLLDGFPEN